MLAQHLDFVGQAVLLFLVEKPDASGVLPQSSLPERWLNSPPIVVIQLQTALRRQSGNPSR